MTHMRKHEITLQLTVDESKLPPKTEDDGTISVEGVDEWVGFTDIVRAANDGAIVEGEIVDYKEVPS